MKRVIIGILAALLLISIWYLFVKKYDYEISFKANLAPIGVYHQVKNIKSNTQKSQSLNQNLGDINLTQEVVLNDEIVFLDWNFKSVNDTVTKIKVGVISKDHSIKNKLQVIIGSSPVVKLVKKDLIQLRKTLRKYTDTFKIIVEGETQIPAMDFLSISSKTKRSRKAHEMMSQNSYLYPKLVSGNVDRKGYPFVKINNWNLDTDELQMDFGVPIILKDSLPVNSIINLTRAETQNALKATYYGNYRTSYEAWFVLLEYARVNKIVVENEPLEIFYNNPMQDGNDSQWKAEVYLPLKNK
ncbi:hypothetical protein U6A24_07375 [Aquimarina gracilis]|uniref:Effector-binding domain-containing protein n=1 Tax=Aquimarina gracilis TaxID=874422 RepID=A0ABU5ZUD2_9FLAO|nr:hypothetical protein [Aquimarina gracilis]MEB3345273.1 hypothetical protein [Aquimarina gracilis]